MDGNDAPVYFGMGDAQRIDRTVNHFERHIIGGPTPRKQSNAPTGNDIACGVLTSGITAASPDGKTGATNFTFKIWRLNPADTSTPQEMLQDADDTVGVNRSQMAFDTGKFGEFVYADGEWRPLRIDCD